MSDWVLLIPPATVGALVGVVRARRRRTALWWNLLIGQGLIFGSLIVLELAWLAIVYIATR